MRCRSVCGIVVFVCLVCVCFFYFYSFFVLVMRVDGGEVAMGLIEAMRVIPVVFFFFFFFFFFAPFLSARLLVV